jgi:hypothetical protein
MCEQGGSSLWLMRKHPIIRIEKNLSHDEHSPITEKLVACRDAPTASFKKVLIHSPLCSAREDKRGISKKETFGPCRRSDG